MGAQELKAQSQVPSPMSCFGSINCALGFTAAAAAAQWRMPGGLWQQLLDMISCFLWSVTSFAISISMLAVCVAWNPNMEVSIDYTAVVLFHLIFTCVSSFLDRIRLDL